MLGRLGGYDNMHDLNIEYVHPTNGIRGYYLSSDNLRIYVWFDDDREVTPIEKVSSDILQQLVDSVIRIHNKQFPEFQYE